MTGCGYRCSVCTGRYGCRWRSRTLGGRRGEEEEEGGVRAYGQRDRERGFDFGSAPLMRVSLLRIGEARWRVLWTVYHLLLDGWSKSVLMEEFLRTYERLVRGEGVDHAGEEGAE